MSKRICPISPYIQREYVTWPAASKDHYGVIVVGAGLVGCMIKKVFEKRGVSVLLIDREKKWASSKCSVGVTSDGWLGDDLERAKVSFSVMSEVGIDIERITAVNMDSDDLAEKEFYFIDPSKVLTEPYFAGRVNKVADREVEVTFEDKEQGRFFTKCLSASYGVIVAAGAWTSDVLLKSGFEDVPKIDAYWGANYDLKIKLEENRFGTWAPYKHSLLMKFPGFARFSDGNTVKNPKGLDDGRLEKFTQRLHNNLNNIIMSSLPQEKVIRINEGIRPYTEKGDFVRMYKDGLYSATGGRKNTSALAGWMADNIWDQMMGGKRGEKHK